ncbi:insulin-like growth factor-binding protein complex acid labile subunit [Lutzomyia longipalpis]|uniref:insulin-like growth factor-binding protein complex acid labile subunit n=1 Tax=Lutzomyia longipalpis TaxID=7200 RepID=UPI002483B509|nr:insulin-like growth factor-binding protein complex acid labile subunit [Lutzomyia longipalpis]
MNFLRKIIFVEVLCVLVLIGESQGATIPCTKKVYAGFFHSTFTCELNGIDFMDSEESTIEESIYLNHLRILNSSISSLPVRILTRLISLQSVVVKAKLNHIDELSLKKVQSVDFSENEVSSLVEFAFSGCPVVREIDLHGNKITNFPGNIFNNLAQLQSVNLAGNGIKKLPIELFSQTPSLEIFWAQFNLIDELKLEMFAHLTTFKQLDLSHNRLKTIESPKTLLSMKPFLGANLELSFNKLLSLSLLNTDIPAINVSSNHLKKITLGKQCKELYAEHNELEEITMGESIKSLEVINLANNELKNKLGDVCRCEKLQEVILASNGIESIGFCFSGMTTLKELDLRRNKLTHIDYGYFPGHNILETLDLSYNEIEEVDAHVLSLLHNLRNFYLDGNKLQDLPDQLARILPQISTIGLSHNLFPCNRLLTIFRQLKGTKKDIIFNIDKPTVVNTTNIHGIICYNTKENDSAQNPGATSPVTSSFPTEVNASIWREMQKIKFELQDYSSLIWKIVKSHENLRDGIAANFSLLTPSEAAKDKNEEINATAFKILQMSLEQTNTRINQLERRFNATDKMQQISDSGQKNHSIYSLIAIFSAVLVLLVVGIFVWYNSDKICIKYCIYRKISFQQSGESLRTFV